MLNQATGDRAMFIEDEKETDLDSLNSIEENGYSLPKFNKVQKGEYRCSFKGFDIKVVKKLIKGYFGEEWCFVIYKNNIEIFRDDYYRAKSCKIGAILYIIEN